MRFAVCLALGLIPASAVQATEFRCYPPDPAGYFQAVQASPDDYRIVLGGFEFDPALLPRRAGSLLFPKVQPIPAQFQGQALGIAGVGADLSFALTIQPSCSMQTCARTTPGIDVIAFVRQGPDGPVLDADPCLSPVFAPDPGTIALLTRCLRGAICN